MPRVEPPAIQPMKSDIERFAKAYFNIDLTSTQMEFIAMVAAGTKQVNMQIRRKHGITTANKVILAYLQEGIKRDGRKRLQLPALPAHLGRSKVKGATQEGRVLNMIKRPGGAFNFELSRLALKYTSVISELRKDGHNIVAERQYLKNGKASNTFRYYLIGG